MGLVHATAVGLRALAVVVMLSGAGLNFYLIARFWRGRSTYWIVSFVAFTIAAVLFGVAHVLEFGFTCGFCDVQLFKVMALIVAFPAYWIGMLIREAWRDRRR